MKILMKPFLALLHADPVVALATAVMLTATVACIVVATVVPLRALFHG